MDFIYYGMCQVSELRFRLESYYNKILDSQTIIRESFVESTPLVV